MAMLESHPRHWLKNGFHLLAPMPDVLLSYCEDCDRDASAVSKEKNPTISADGNFIPRTPSLFYLGPAVTDADTTECQNFVNQVRIALVCVFDIGMFFKNFVALDSQVGFLHQDQCRELQYFRTKKRRVDFRLEELETLIAKLKKKRRVVTRLDEVEQTIRALEIRSEDWEKAGLQLVWPMPDRLLQDNRIVSDSAI
ncbi:unnamed protein product [Arabidopsis thaliana]|uniref:(thale cress) hypothetical protein n=1 Tax=Arabidopsis thaliana TaxID=3702 RepID=A0A7G2EZW8_ARATH|nr:unnamed protein product [Arabidopsis thaliana]